MARCRGSIRSRARSKPRSRSAGCPPASRSAPVLCGWRTACPGRCRASTRARTASRRRSSSEGRRMRSRSPAAACGSPSRKPRRVRRRREAARWRACSSATTSGRAIPRGSATRSWRGAICARLMTYASPSGSGAGHLVPELATTPPAVSGDGRVYTFRVRAGYRFSPPSGRPVTAAAFQRAIERALNRRTNSDGAGFAADIAGAAAYRAGRARTVTGVSARHDRLTIRLTRPSPTLPARMATFYFCAVPPETPDPAARSRSGRDRGAVLHRRGRAARAPRASPQPRLSRSAPAASRGDRGHDRHAT